MNEKAIGQGMLIESVVHHQDLMIDIWADGSLMYCLSSTGHIDIIKYRKPGTGAIRSSDLHRSVFTKSTPKSDGHAAVALTGTERYLAVATYDQRESLNTIWLTDRRGKILKKTYDRDEIFINGYAQTIHRMEF